MSKRPRKSILDDSSLNGNVNSEPKMGNKYKLTSKDNKLKTDNKIYWKSISEIKKQDELLLKYFRQNIYFLQLRNKITIYEYFHVDNPTSLPPKILQKRFLNIIYPNIHRYGLSFPAILQFYGYACPEIYNNKSRIHVRKCLHNLKNNSLGYISDNILVGDTSYLFISVLEKSPLYETLSKVHNVSVQNIYNFDLESFCLMHYVKDFSKFISALQSENDQIDISKVKKISYLNVLKNNLNIFEHNENNNYSSLNSTHSSVCLSTSNSSLDESTNLKDKILVVSEVSQEIEIIKPIILLRKKKIKLDPNIIVISSDEE